MREKRGSVSQSVKVADMFGSGRAQLLLPIHSTATCSSRRCSLSSTRHRSSPLPHRHSLRSSYLWTISRCCSSWLPSAVYTSYGQSVVGGWWDECGHHVLEYGARGQGQDSGYESTERGGRGEDGAHPAERVGGGRVRAGGEREGEREEGERPSCERWSGDERGERAGTRSGRRRRTAWKRRRSEH